MTVCLKYVQYFTQQRQELYYTAKSAIDYFLWKAVLVLWENWRGKQCIIDLFWLFVRGEGLVSQHKLGGSEAPEEGG